MNIGSLHLTFRIAALIAVAFLVFAMVIGVYLRGFWIVPFPFGYRDVIHVHSHLAVLGWGYNALFLLFCRKALGYAVLPLNGVGGLFIFLQLTLLGMLMTFPFGGYWAGSIAFSSLHIIGFYLFIAHGWQRMYRQPNVRYGSRWFIRTAMVMMLVSSAGPWALGVFSGIGLGGYYYDLALNFYLHFQFNGWFAFALAGLLLYESERSGIRIPENALRHIGWSLLSGVILTFLVYVEDGSGGLGLSALSVAGGLLYLNGAVRMSAKLYSHQGAVFNGHAPFSPGRLALGAWMTSALMIAVSALPGVSGFIMGQHDMQVGFIHWYLLGFVTLSLIAMFRRERWAGGYGLIQRTGYSIFIGGFLMNSLYLFAYGFLSEHGFVLPAYREVLLLAGACMFLGLVLFLLKGRKSR